jgi:hypothetical protein
MGMTAVCSAGCGYSAPSDSHRGGQLGGCPQCGQPMQGWTAGQAKGRYLCPLTGRVVTLGLSYTTQITGPMRACFVAGFDLDHQNTVPDPDNPRRMRPAWRWRDEPDHLEQQFLTAAAGRVFGPGAVFARDFTRGARLRRDDRADVYLLPAPGTDPAGWFVNQPLKYRKCAGCSRRVPVTEQTLTTGPWTPRRTCYYPGRGWNTARKPVNPGPHPAGTVACDDCDPRRTDEPLI